MDLSRVLFGSFRVDSKTGWEVGSVGPLVHRMQVALFAASCRGENGCHVAGRPPSVGVHERDSSKQIARPAGLARPVGTTVGGGENQAARAHPPPPVGFPEKNPGKSPKRTPGFVLPGESAPPLMINTAPSTNW